jgi:cobalt/nickel transport system permease protein
VTAKRRIGFGLFVTGALAATVLVALLASPWASDEPDGLERVAIDEGFAAHQTDHALEASPTAGYALGAVDDDRLSTGLAGVIGVAVTFTIATGVAVALRRRTRASTA